MPAPNYILKNMNINSFNDIYLILNERCESRSPFLEWPREVVDPVLFSCERLMIRHLWIGIASTFLQDPDFITFAQYLVQLRKMQLIKTITLQCKLSENLHISNLPSFVYDFTFSLIVCETPNCGVEFPSNIIRTYQEIKMRITNIMLVGPSILTCIKGIDAGNGLRRQCLIQPHLVFIFPNGMVQRCPVGRFSALGNVFSQPLYSILSNIEPELEKLPISSIDAKTIKNICKKCLER